MLQGGDCAEIFAEATADRIRNKIKTILQMAVILTYGASTPVIKIGRLAGQYAKPRSSDTETRDGVTLPAYRGDIINSSAFTADARIPNPERMMDAYNVSASTLNLVRAFTHGGFADLRRVHAWNRGFAANPAYARYEYWRDADKTAFVGDEFRRAGPTPPHFANLTLPPAVTPTSASRSSIVTALSSATMGSGDRSWSARSWSSRRAGNGCSMSSTPSRSRTGSSARAPSGDHPVFASTRIGPS